MKKMPIWVSMAAGMAIGAAAGTAARLCCKNKTLPRRLIHKAKSALTSMENRLF